MQWCFCPSVHSSPAPTVRDLLPRADPRRRTPGRLELGVPIAQHASVLSWPSSPTAPTVPNAPAIPNAPGGPARQLRAPDRAGGRARDANGRRRDVDPLRAAVRVQCNAIPRCARPASATNRRRAWAGTGSRSPPRRREFAEPPTRSAQGNEPTPRPRWLCAMIPAVPLYNSAFVPPHIRPPVAAAAGARGQRATRNPQRESLPPLLLVVVDGAAQRAMVTRRASKPRKPCCSS